MTNQHALETEATRSAPPTLTGQDVAEAQGALRAVLDHALARTGMSSNGYVVMRVLAVGGTPTTPVAFHDYLAGQRQLGLDADEVAALLHELETDGLVKGSSIDGPGPVELTAEGAARHARLAEYIKPVTQRVFADLDTDDLAVAHRVLVRITHQAEQVRRSL